MQAHDLNGGKSEKLQKGRNNNSPMEEDLVVRAGYRERNSDLITVEI